MGCLYRLPITLSRCVAWLTFTCYAILPMSQAVWSARSLFSVQEPAAHDCCCGEACACAPGSCSAPGSPVGDGLQIGTCETDPFNARVQISPLPYHIPPCRVIWLQPETEPARTVATPQPIQRSLEPPAPIPLDR